MEVFLRFSHCTDVNKYNLLCSAMKLSFFSCSFSYLWIRLLLSLSEVKQDAKFRKNDCAYEVLQTFVLPAFWTTDRTRTEVVCPSRCHPVFRTIPAAHIEMGRRAHPRRSEASRGARPSFPMHVSRWTRYCLRVLRFLCVGFVTKLDRDLWCKATSPLMVDSCHVVEHDLQGSQSCFFSAIDPVLSSRGALVGLAPQTKFQAPPNWNVKHYE